VPTAAETCALAFQHHQAGQLNQAEQLYRQVLQADPGHADAHHLLGVLAYQMGQIDMAIDSMRQALALNPGAAEYHSNLGLAYVGRGQLDQAVASYQRALRLQPHYPEAHANLGNALLQQGQQAEAVAHYTEALRLKPNLAEPRCNLGVVLANQGKVDEAVAHWQEVIRGWPDYPEAHNNLSNALLSQGQADQAVWHARQAIRFRPDFAGAHNNLANALLSQGKLEEAVSHCRQALRFRPDFPEAHYNLGIALRDQGKLEEAVDSYQRALHFKPDFAAAHNNLGDVLLKLGLPELALASIQQALRLQPDLGAAQRNVLFYSNYDPRADPDAVFAAHRRWGQAQESPKSEVRSPKSKPPLPTSDIGHRTSDFHRTLHLPERRLRIGYVSPDLRLHALARYLEPVLAHHDSQQVEVFCYAEVQVPDAVTARLQRLAHGWRSTCHLTDAQVAESIRSDRIDILVDLAGHTRNSRLSVFALKPAPVQATWLGYLNTTGLTTVDYRLTDDGLDPPAQPVRDTEELVRLPGGMCCFGPPADAPAVTPPPALRQGYLTFGSLHNLFKLNASVFDLWSKLLKALPSARLLLFRDALTAPAQARIRREFTQRGIASERLDLRHGSAAPGFLRIYGEIDVGLDAFPCSGGVTTCESLWMGVPVLTLRGVRPAGRNSAALLARVGLNALAVDTPEEYLAFAVRLADDLDQLRQLRTGLRDRMTTTLCDAVRFTRVLEEAYRTMWRRWCSDEVARSRNPKS